MLYNLFDYAVAIVLVLNPTQERYVGRQAALLMDDYPNVRAALKEYVVREKLMFGYQATLFDDRFGAAAQALTYARRWHQDRLDSQLPNYPIQSGKDR